VKHPTPDLNFSLILKIGIGILLAGMWLGALQMQVSRLQADHDFHYGAETR